MNNSNKVMVKDGNYNSVYTKLSRLVATTAISMTIVLPLLSASDISMLQDIFSLSNLIIIAG